MTTLQRRWLTKEEIRVFYKRSGRTLDNEPDHRAPWVTSRELDCIGTLSGRPLSVYENTWYNDPCDWAECDNLPNRVPAWLVTTDPLPPNTWRVITKKEAIEKYGPDWRFSKAGFIFYPKYDDLLLNKEVDYTKLELYEDDEVIAVSTQQGNRLVHIYVPVEFLTKDFLNDK